MILPITHDCEDFPDGTKVMFSWRHHLSCPNGTNMLNKISYYLSKSSHDASHGVTNIHETYDPVPFLSMRFHNPLWRSNPPPWSRPWFPLRGATLLLLSCQTLPHCNYVHVGCSSMYRDNSFNDSHFTHCPPTLSSCLSIPLSSRTTATFQPFASCLGGQTG